jgi:predicted nucleotidyltransferase
MDNKKDKKLISEIIKKYILVIKHNNIKLRKMYLYGSYAHNKQNKDSDIDIAVVADNLTGNIIKDQFKLMKLSRDIDTRIEPYPFRTSEFDLTNPFVKEIVSTGIKIL